MLCYTVSADRVYILWHVMLYSVCRQTVYTVACYVTQCLQTDCTVT